MATYAEIQEYVEEMYACTVKTCWIAHVRELTGLPVKRSHKRMPGSPRKHPCPEWARPMIEEAMRDFGMLPNRTQARTAPVLSRGRA